MGILAGVGAVFAGPGTVLALSGVGQAEVSVSFTFRSFF